jgi:hypothetical protein
MVVARYLFHLHNGDGRTEEPEGREFDGPTAARCAAIQDARSIICADVQQGRLDLSGYIDTTDAAGTTVVTITFREAANSGSGA